MKLNFTLPLIISLFFCKASFAQVNVQDSLALVDLYDSTKGKIGWVLSEPVIKWKGITTSEGRVTEIMLVGFTEINFKLPTSIGNLSALITLNFRSSSLSGEVPVEIGKLKNLQTLNLGWTFLNTNIPESIGNLVNLRILDISGPDRLSYNIKGDIPSSIGNLINLEYLNLANNKLTGSIPISLGNLIRLKILRLYSNQLTGSIPSSLGNLINLQELYLNFNKLSDSIPSSLGNLRKVDIRLDNNQLTGQIPFSLGNLTTCTFLDLSNNFLNGTIPTSLENCLNLGTLDLSQNKISGAIPVSLTNIKTLIDIDLSQNNLTGTIPTTFDKLTNLRNLSLEKNNLTGSIPASLGNLADLQGLYLSYNNLTDTIPSSLGKLSNLQILNLDHNNLNGTVPLTLANFVSSITTINISNNDLTFSGIEQLANAFKNRIYNLKYNEQARISINNTNGLLWANAGGTLANNTYMWYKADALTHQYSIISTKIGDSTFAPTLPGIYRLKINNSIANNLTLYSYDFTVGGDSLILPAKPSTVFANREYTNSDGWTDYYFDNNTPYDISDDTLLLSLKKNGQNIGSIGDGTFAVKVVATKDAGTNKGIFLSNPLITNSSGYWVMNRYWQVTPSAEPVKSIGVRFYYNNQDLKDVNGSYPTHNLTNQDLIMYKAIDGNPDPTTNLSGASKIISIMPGNTASDTTWTYHQLSDTTQYAEYSVSSFSGGGGGGTGNNKSLPITLVNFTANLNNSNAVLKWQTVTEINSSYFNIQRSLDGRNFTTIAKTKAAGNSSLKLNYEYTDPSVVKIYSGRIYYRLVEIDKNGVSNYSIIIPLDLPLNNKHITILPNPVHDILQVQLNKLEGKAAIGIYDIKGRKLQSTQVILTGNQNLIFNVASLPSGVYLFKVENAAKEETLQFIKQ